MTKLQKILARPVEQNSFSRAELAASFGILRDFIDDLALHLSRQELEDVLRDFQGGGRKEDRGEQNSLNHSQDRSVPKNR